MFYRSAPPEQCQFSPVVQFVVLALLQRRAPPAVLGVHLESIILQRDRYSTIFFLFFNCHDEFSLINQLVFYFVFQGVCSPCPSGSFTNVTSQYSCLDCLPGSFVVQSDLGQV